ncbi:MAG: hypothetical protein IT438_13455 [Phycisphaerales bacterium]|nr:hypothetical protein [Phycisphaerales bacterium]
MSQPRSASTHLHRFALAPVAAAFLATSIVAYDALASAQPPAKPANTPVRRGRVVKQPIVDLAKQAAARRPGQVLPGDPPPEKFAPPIAPPPPAQSPAPAAAATELNLPDTPKPKAAPVPVERSAGPHPVQPTAAPTAPTNTAEPPPSSPEPKSATPEPPPQPEQPTLNVLRGPRDASATTSTGEAASLVLSAVYGLLAGVQWRPVSAEDAPWQTPAPGDQASGRYELRTGLQSEATLTVDGGVTVQVGRLSRVVVERSPATGVPTILVYRGTVEVLPTSGSVEHKAIVRSPDRSKPVEAQPGLRVSYGAFRGTQIERVQVTGIGGF